MLKAEVWRIRKIMPAGLMPAAIRPILKLSFTKDPAIQSVECFPSPGWEPFFCLLMPVNACGAALVLPRLIDASFLLEPADLP
jgi:hypothetical protein